MTETVTRMYAAVLPEADGHLRWTIRPAALRMPNPQAMSCWAIQLEGRLVALRTAIIIPQIDKK